MGDRALPNVMESPEDVCRRQIMQRIGHEEDLPVEVDDLVYFFVSYVNSLGVSLSALEGILDLWLQERREYMQTEKGLEMGG